MKTAVSIPDELFLRADELAHQLGKSRSELYREALTAYVAQRDPMTITATLDELADDLAGERDDLVVEAARRTLQASEW